jgi:hypothetical protein
MTLAVALPFTAPFGRAAYLPIFGPGQIQLVLDVVPAQSSTAAPPGFGGTITIGWKYEYQFNATLY